ncbi:hypothetical protein KCTC52924_00904 [Arenibacter antarcticus]|uniref:Fibronectin type-III domain-containing protein n=1 Tax=Arenibacter antarcticus TaxID=2040469 RepID=A0ABW5VC79_9FLAO|nr:hypothetical protein [Arenibacter sp. H213]MCM4167594.1 hypothetical protein [Arenibacter sp. H213]
MRSLAITMCFLALIACGGKDSTKAPIAAQLAFPQKNSECTTGQDVNGSNTSIVEFSWIASDHTESYDLRATNLNTNTTQTVNSSSTSAKLPIEKGSPYSWLVVSKNSNVRETARSETWLFYNSGSTTTYAPFPAAVVAPKSGSTISKDLNNQVLLDWDGADVDNDLAGYKVYFSTTNPPTTLITTLTSGKSNLQVSVSSDTVYYWRIVSFDLEGNSATNAVSEFKVR